MVAAALPDIDVIAFRFGIPYDDQFGHRGATHSLAFAVLIGVLAALFSRRLKSSRLLAFCALALATASHTLTDMLTNGGRGVELFWPLDTGRYFFPFRPVEVSPIGAAHFLSSDALLVIASEWLWLLVPVILFASLVRIAEQRGAWPRTAD
jgi:inner membrane protein